ncbi:MAG: RNA polymerase subunit sigma [Caldithrix sp.]|nr:RNA polymerase subunit sigma [Caldithrix sp.]
MSTPNIVKAADRIKKGKRVVGFSGAGISVESGIPPFRGSNGLWNKYDPGFLEIDYFLNHPRESWIRIKEIFYDFFGQAQPNAAHIALGAMERAGLVQAVITQNIDNLHQQGGSQTVYEFHGNYQRLICLDCHMSYEAAAIDLGKIPPLCDRCSGVLKPDFIFFGEAIPEPARSLSFAEADHADVFIIIGSTGEVMPAASIPPLAKQAGAFIIEINIEPSNYTHRITDVFLQGRATVMMHALARHLNV